MFYVSLLNFLMFVKTDLHIVSVVMRLFDFLLSLKFTFVFLQCEIRNMS